MGSFLEKERKDNKYKLNDYMSNFRSYLKQSSCKNNNLVKISFDQRKKNEEFPVAIEIPKRLKFQMDLIKNKSNKNKINKALNNNEISDNDIDMENLNYDKEYNESEILNNNKNKNFDNKKILIGKEKKRISNDKDGVKIKKYFSNETLNSQKTYNNFRTSHSEKKDPIEKNIVSGIHAAKIRLLKGLDLDGNKKKSDTYLNVKCVGLKADFNFNNNDISEKKNLSKTIDKNINMKKTVNGFFPAISKNESN